MVVARSALLNLKTEAEYHDYYKREYCRKSVVTWDGVRVYFKDARFAHAFYESSKKDSQKDLFSAARAQRMNWIRETLVNPQSSIFQGWDKKKRRYDTCRRVCIAYEDFVVVIKMGLKKTGELKAEFVTCFKADNSISKIKGSPKWSKKTCLKALNKKGR